MMPSTRINPITVSELIDYLELGDVADLPVDGLPFGTRKRVEIASLVALGGFFCLLLALYRYPLSGDVYPIDNLPVLLGPWDVLLPAVAAVLICGLVSGPVALVAARLPVLEGLRR